MENIRFHTIFSILPQGLNCGQLLDIEPFWLVIFIDKGKGEKDIRK
jgi:hypothetical protein